MTRPSCQVLTVKFTQASHGYGTGGEIGAGLVGHGMETSSRQHLSRGIQVSTRVKSDSGVPTLRNRNSPYVGTELAVPRSALIPGTPRMLTRAFGRSRHPSRRRQRIGLIRAETLRWHASGHTRPCRARFRRPRHLFDPMTTVGETSGSRGRVDAEQLSSLGRTIVLRPE
jgi:hypothetical protein